MKVQRIRDMKIRHRAGEIVEVAPAEYQFLLSTNSALAIPIEADKPAKKAKPKK